MRLHDSQYGSHVAIDTDIHTALVLYVAEYGLISLMKKLIAEGANVNAQGGEYGNVLQTASFWGRQRIVELLIAKGADVNAQGGEYGSALVVASATGREGTVELLMKEGANDYGNALKVALRKEHYGIVKMLFDADPQVIECHALKLALDEGQYVVAKLILCGRAQHSPCGGGECALGIARRM